MAVCLKYKKVAFADTGIKTAIFTRLRCKQWSCEECAKTNAWVWRQWLEKRLPEISEEWYLVTLTAGEDDRSTYGSLKNIRDNLDRMFKRMRRVFGEISYVRVYERHPTSSAIHVHIIMAGLSPFVALGCSVKMQPMAIGILRRQWKHGIWALKTWVKKTCREIGMGYIADVQCVQGGIKAMFYVTKYLTKSQQDIPIKGLRHVQVSSDIGSPRGEKNDLIWNTASYITANMFAPNTKIHDINTGGIIDNNHWELHSFYPID